LIIGSNVDIGSGCVIDKGFKNLDTVINGATPEIKVTGLVYNWPYNDLYWNSRCSTTPVGEIPINLVPC
jgi:hypothetical protein